METKISYKDYLSQFDKLIRKVDELEVRALSDAVAQAWADRRTVFIIGNGGSGANASHLCEDLGKGTLRDFDSQKRLRAISLTDNTPYILAWANDEGFDRIFVEQLKNLAEPKDLLIAISGSGNSPNVLEAVRWANDHGLTTFGVTGYDGGKLRGLCRLGLHAPSHNMGLVEAAHAVIFHYLIDELRERFDLRQ